MRITIILFMLTIASLAEAQRFKSVKSSDTVDFSGLSIQSLLLTKDTISPSFAVFDSIALNANVYFVGENHNYRAANTELQIAFIHYLHETAGLKHIVMEFGTARGWLVDKYINNSSDSTYGEYLRLYSFPEYFAYYKKLRELNLSYPDSLRLRVYGIDVERFNETPLKVLSLLIPNAEAPDSIALNIESITGIAGYNDNYLKEKKSKSLSDNLKPGMLYQYGSRTFSSEKTVSTIIDEYYKYQNYYKEFLSDSAYQLFDIIISELRDQRVYESYSRQTHQHVYREMYMYKKFISYSAMHPNEKIFGQFGRCHVSVQRKDNQCMWFDFYSVAARLNNTNSSFLKGKVSSIAYFYEDDVSMKNSVDNQAQLSALFREMSKKDTITVVKVNRDSLIFGDYSKSFDFIIFDRRPIEESSADFLDDELDYEYEVVGNFSIGFGLRAHYPNYTSFNTYLNSKSYGGLKTPEQSFVISMAVNSIKGFCISSSGFFSQKQELYGQLDSTNLSSHYYGMSFDFGWSLLNSKYVFFKPQIGMGFIGSYLDINQSVAKINPDLDFFGTPQISNYANVHWYFSPSAEIIFKWRFVGLGFTGGYIYSPFNSDWRNSQGTKLPIAPDISVDGFFWQSNFYFMFDF